MREFGIPIEQVEVDNFEDREFYDTVKVAGRNIDLFYPTPGQVALLMMGDTDLDTIANMLTILGYMMSREDKQFVRHAILRRALDEEQIGELAGEVLEAVSGRADFPTKQSSASTRSQRSTGRPSTANSRRARSPRGTSPRPASATSSTGD